MGLGRWSSPRRRSSLAVVGRTLQREQPDNGWSQPGEPPPAWSSGRHHRWPLRGHGISSLEDRVF